MQQPDPPLRARTRLPTSRQLTYYEHFPNYILQPASQRSQSSLSAPSRGSPGPSTSDLDTVQQVRGQHCNHGPTVRALNYTPRTTYLASPQTMHGGKTTQNVVIADETGYTKLTLWEEHVRYLQPNKSYYLKNMLLRVTIYTVVRDT